MSRENYWDFEPPLADEGWTAVETGLSTTRRSTSAAWPQRGTMGGRVTVSGSSVAYLRQDAWCTPPLDGQTRVVGFWYRQTAQSPDTNFHYQLRLFANGASEAVAGWGIYDRESGTAGFIRGYDDVGTSLYAYYSVEARPTLNRWTYVQMAMKRASSDVASDGSLALYFDGVQVASLTDLDNYDTFDTNGQMRLGSSIVPRDGYSADFDEVKIGQSLADTEPFAPAPLGDYPQARRTVLLVPDTADGRDFAAHCVADLALPRANVCILPNASANESLADYAAFQTEVETDLAAYLAARPTVADRVTTFLIGPGLPGYFTHAGMKHSATSRLMHFGGTFAPQTSNPLYAPSTVARLTVADLRSAGTYLATRIDADTLQHAKDILSAGRVVSGLAALPATDVLYSDDATYLASLPCQQLRLTSAAIGALTNGAFMWGDESSATFDPSGSRAFYAPTSPSSGSSLRSVGTNSMGDAMNFRAWAAGLGHAETPDTWNATRFFEMLRIGGTLAEACGVAVASVDYTSVAAGDPLMTVAMVTGGYNVYRGRGDLSNVDFDTPVACLPPGRTSTALAGLGHEASTHYVYAVRPVRNGLEGPDMSCHTEFVTDSAAEWTGARPVAVELVEADAQAGGQVTVRWTFRTP